MRKVGICFIFNHPFPAQIPILKRLYGDRFSEMLFLIPFHCDETDCDIHTVYHGAFSFDAMVVDARHRIADKFKDCSHVLFVHNDLLLAGRYNETSVVDLLKLEGERPFIAHFSKVKGSAFDWLWKARLPYKWRFPMDTFLGTGAEKAKNYFPTDAMIRLMCRESGLGDENSSLRRDDGRLNDLYYYNFVNEQIYANKSHTGNTGTFDFEYPLFGGYSDIFAVPMSKMDMWMHLLGVLSSMHLFPEITIPTSLVWTFGKVNTQGTCWLKTAILWEDRHLTDDINWVIAQFKDRMDYIHPVKYEKYDEQAYSDLIKTLQE
jgi:hypothetical protein